MGCTESVPVANSWDIRHDIDPKATRLGSKHGAGPQSQKIQLLVREKLFSWSGDDFRIMTRDGTPFGNLKIKGKVWALRDQMVLENGDTGEPVAVCLRKFQLVGQTFKIYSLQPVYPGQTPSERTCEHRNKRYKLYTYASVERVPLSTEQFVKLENGDAYTIHRAGSLWPKKRVVKRRGQPAAFMEGGTWEGNWNSYLLSICPGIDPCLIICLSAVCDEMDEDN